MPARSRPSGARLTRSPSAIRRAAPKAADSLAAGRWPTRVTSPPAARPITTEASIPKSKSGAESQSAFQPRSAQVATTVVRAEDENASTEAATATGKTSRSGSSRTGMPLVYRPPGEGPDGGPWKRERPRRSSGAVRIRETRGLTCPGRRTR